MLHICSENKHSDITKKQKSKNKFYCNANPLTFPTSNWKTIKTHMDYHSHPFEYPWCQSKWESTHVMSACPPMSDRKCWCVCLRPFECPYAIILRCKHTHTNTHIHQRNRNTNRIAYNNIFNARREQGKCKLVSLFIPCFNRMCWMNDT